MMKTTTKSLTAAEIAALNAKIANGSKLTAAETRSVLLTAKLGTAADLDALDALLDAVEAAI